jgi:hypothetical protein
VVGGLVLDVYRDNKDKLKSWLKRMRRENQLFGLRNPRRDVFSDVFEIPRRPALFDKFCSVAAEQVLADFDSLLTCYIARCMFEQGALAFEDYLRIVSRTMPGGDISDDGALAKRFDEFRLTYQDAPDAIHRERVFLAIDAYAKGTLAQKLDEVDIKLPLPENRDVAAFFKGIPAAPFGAVTGIARLPESEPTNADYSTIFVIDANLHGPENIVDIIESSGVVTTNCRFTHHLPVVCRGLGKSCVILTPGDFARIRNGDRIGICGTTGVVGIGVVVKLPLLDLPLSNGEA